MAVVHRFKSKSMKGWDGKPLWIKMHVVPTSSKVEAALEDWVDSYTYRRDEWNTYRGGLQDLAESLIRIHELEGEDRECFIDELKARRYGLNYDLLRGEAQKVWDRDKFQTMEERVEFLRRYDSLLDEDR